MRLLSISKLQRLCLLTLLSITFSNCTAPKSIRQAARAERLIEKAARLNPDILETSSDTVYSTVTLYDTLRQPSARYVDTIHAPAISDTLRLTDTLGRAEALLIWHPVNPRLILNIPELVKPVAVTGTVPVVVNQTEVKQTRFYRLWRSGYRWSIILGIVLLIAGLAWLAKKLLP